MQLVEKNYFAPLAQITAEVQDITGKSISISTVQRALHMEGYAGRVGLRKPFVNDRNRLNRLKCSHERLTWDKEWNQIIWSDESCYELFGSKHHQWVWHHPEQRTDDNCLVPTFKSTQKSMMVWGCFMHFGVGPLV